HQIEVSRAGSLITVKADGAVLMQANDATFGAGRVGIGAFNDAAWWDDVAIAAPTTSFSTLDPYLGDAANWEPLNASRWSVAMDGGDLRYGITTADYSELPVSRLGEYSLVKGRTYADFTFSARVRSSENFAANANADHAVVFGLQDAANYYYAMFNRNAANTQLFKVVGGVRQPALANGNYAIPDNEYHQIEVSRAGSLITVKADGAVLMQANDATFGAGRIGIGAFNDAAWWDDIAIAVLAPADTSPPSTPTNVTATALSFSEVAVSWSASTDDVGVTGYRVYRDATLVASPTGTSASVTGLSGGALYAFSVAALDAAGNASTQSAPVLVTTPVPVPPTISFSAVPATIAAGQPVTLTWSSTNASSCTASEGWSGTRPTSGSQDVAPTATTTYILTCMGIGGAASTSLLVTVTALVPTLSLTASPASIAAGESSTLTWSSTGAGSCTASGGWSGPKATSGSQAVSPASTTSYALSCTGAGGGASQSATVTVAAGAITSSLVPSRVSGVAPLAVFFDATATTAAATNRPFHELEYRWDFGDTASGSWASTPGMPNVSRNHATGPVAAHVFETPGTYTVSLTVLDGAGAATKTVQITVTDPDTVFAANTLCVGNSQPLAGSGGCPAGAAGLQSNNFNAAINNNIASRKRILFRRGDTFVSSDNANVGVTGPGLIGAFGSGAAPVVNVTGNNRAIQLSSGTTPGLKDWRIMDLEIDGNSGAATEGIHAEGGMDQVTLLRLNIHHVHEGVMLSPDILDFYGGQHRLWDQFAVVDSTIRTIIGGGGGYGVYLGAQRFSLMGNVLSDTTASEHILRTPNIVKAVISHNDMSNPARAKHVVKLHAMVFGVSPTGFTEQVVMSDNKFTGGAGVDWTVTLGPQDQFQNEKVRDVIVERNWFAPAPGQQVALMVWAQDVTVRNNIFNLTGALARNGMVVERRGGEPLPANVHVYNNTFYSNSAGGFFPIQFVLGAGMVAKNNLGYAPLSTSRDMVSGAAAVSGNSSDADILLAPAFAAAAPVAPADFSLRSGSYAVNAGTAVPVFSDLFRLDRPQGGAIDIGAAEMP
ncbi:MAG TPA: PKD domain-containing protein, partial [Vicinamibacterales bacterium]|nr:PKD domain-containing protein [Vicinamibacterales bacterium]